METQGRTAEDTEAKEQFYIALCAAQTSTWKFLTFTIHHLNQPKRGNHADKMCHERVDVGLNEEYI
jgi:hypothetical protein